VQYIGLLFERGFFFAQANHPQNIYYQTVLFCFAVVQKGRR
jgi:sulfite dehydrogenase (quinone) subunit SoeC